MYLFQNGWACWVQLGAVDGMQGQPMMSKMKMFLRGFAVLIIPATASFPKVRLAFHPTKYPEVFSCPLPVSMLISLAKYWFLRAKCAGTFLLLAHHEYVLIGANLRWVFSLTFCWMLYWEPSYMELFWNDIAALSYELVSGWADFCSFSCFFWCAFEMFQGRNGVLSVISFEATCDKEGCRNSWNSTSRTSSDCSPNSWGIHHDIESTPKADKEGQEIVLLLLIYSHLVFLKELGAKKYIRKRLFIS